MLDPKRKLFRWGPISACPLFMYFAIEPAFAPLKDLLGICYPQSTIIFYDEKVLWLLDNEEFMKYSGKFTKSIIFNKTKRKQYFSIWDTLTNNLIKTFTKLDKLNFSKTSNSKLIKTYQEFAEVYYDWWTIAISLELATSTIEPLLGEQLKVYYKNENQKNYTKAFSTLTSPLVLTFYRQEQKELLNILTLPKNKQEEALKKHQKKFYWIYNSYFEGKVLELDYFRSELKKASNSDFKKILKEIENYPSFIKKEKKEIFDKINPSKDLKEVISLIELFGKLQDERKMYNFRGDHYLQKFAIAFSVKKNIDILSLKLLVLNELSEQEVKKDLIEKRKTGFVLDCNSEKIINIDGENALAVARQFIDVPNVNQKIIQGTVASVGEQRHFRGTAKIVLTINEIRKIKEGDILVTTMTSPDFVIGMKKAGAILTDVGGMLSHAAVVSRELKIPCIVGTEIATKMIHDGDVLELHCAKGTVRIINSSL